MNIKLLSKLLVIFLIVTVGCQNNENSQFIINKGVNISHWLSQSDRRGEERADFFTKEDVAFIAMAGYDHIRLPIDEEQMWDENGDRYTDAFDLMHQAIKWCGEHQLKVIVDLHILRSHHFNDKEKPLWDDPAEQDKFIWFWKELQSELKKYPVSMVAYELMNEAVADDPDDWNNLIDRAVKEIRLEEPGRKIVIGSNRWQSVHTFKDLKIPEGDSNLILSFHFYEPFVFTHYRAPWTSLYPYDGPVKYPGQIIDTADLEDFPDELVSEYMNYELHFTKASIDSLVQLPLEYAREHNLPLYCGEWGCLKTVDDQYLLQWYKDVRDVFERYDIPWTNWDYKGSFGIVKNDGEIYVKLLNLLIPESESTE